MISVDIRNKTAAIIVGIALALSITGWFVYDIVKQYKIDRATAKVIKTSVEKATKTYVSLKAKLALHMQDRIARKTIRKVCGSFLNRTSTTCKVHRITLNHGLTKPPKNIIRCRPYNGKNLCEFTAPYRKLNCEYVTRRLTCRHGLFQCVMWRTGLIKKRYLDCGLIPKE